MSVRYDSFDVQITYYDGMSIKWPPYPITVPFTGQDDPLIVILRERILKEAQRLAAANTPADPLIT